MPSNRLHRAVVVQHRSVGKGYHRLVMKAAEAAKTALPGQFVMLRVSDNLDPLLARPFGISSVIAKHSLELYYRVVGRGTSLLTTMGPGSVLTMLGPIGKGFSLPGKGEHPLLVAGGSGFPPLLYLASRLPAGARLFFGARNGACMLPESVITGFRKRNVQVHLATEDGCRGTHGLVTDALEDHLRRRGREGAVIYACGPHPMLAAISGLAASHAVRCYVSMEERMACGLGVCMGCSVGVKAGGYRRVCTEGPVFDANEIDWREQVVLPVSYRK